MLLQASSKDVTQDKHPEALDPSLMILLIKQLKELIVKSLSLDGTTESRLEISNQANQLKQLMMRAENQIKNLMAGDLSLLDQEELISKLEKRVQLERDVLKFMSDALSSKE